MQWNTVIFDMDGLLIDSEPLWHEAADDVFALYRIKLSLQEHLQSTGMRTKEFVEYWFSRKGVPAEKSGDAVTAINQCIVEKVRERGKPLPGIEHILNFFLQRNFKIGLASSSPMPLIEVVIDKLGIGQHMQAVESAALLPFGKPHPQVYLNCAASLGSLPRECICFEDSFNGMIAAKAAGMKCVVVPALHDSKDPRFMAADMRISSLQNFNDLLLQTL